MRKTLLSTAVGVVCAFVSAAVHAALAVNVLEAFVETSILYDASVSDDPSQIDQDSLDNHLDTIAYSSMPISAARRFRSGLSSMAANCVSTAFPRSIRTVGRISSRSKRRFQSRASPGASVRA